MKVFASLLFISSLVCAAYSATCRYEIGSQKMTCNHDGQVLTYAAQGNLPKGHYRIGVLTIISGLSDSKDPGFWLYRRVIGQPASGNKVYEAQTTEFYCVEPGRGYSIRQSPAADSNAIGPNSIESGIVVDPSSFERLRDLIRQFPPTPFAVKKCKDCASLECLSEPDTRAFFTADLEVMA